MKKHLKQKLLLPVGAGIATAAYLIYRLLLAPTSGTEIQLPPGAEWTNKTVPSLAEGRPIDLEVADGLQNNCWSDVFILSGYPFDGDDWIQPIEARKIIAKDYKLLSTVTNNFAEINTANLPAGALIVINVTDKAQGYIWGAHVAYLANPETGETINDNGFGGRYTVELPGLFEPGYIATSRAPGSDGELLVINITYSPTSVEIYIPKSLGTES